MTNAEAARHRAEASFKKKELRVREGAEAMADYEAAGRALEMKTARLKALRLAKEERASEPRQRKIRATPLTRTGSWAGTIDSTKLGQEPGFRPHKV